MMTPRTFAGAVALFAAAPVAGFRPPAVPPPRSCKGNTALGAASDLADPSSSSGGGDRARRISRVAADAANYNRNLKRRRRSHRVPTRPLAPPFPDASSVGGTFETISSEDIFGVPAVTPEGDAFAPPVSDEADATNSDGDDDSAGPFGLNLPTLPSLPNLPTLPNLESAIGTAVGAAAGEVDAASAAIASASDAVEDVSGAALTPRDVEVWLPPGYEEGEGVSRHPVLYCHDGQNAVSDRSSWTGHSWRMAGALVRLAERNLLRGRSPPSSSPSSEENDDSVLPILVLLPSASGDLLPGVRRRHLEYGDVSVPHAQAHADLVVQKIKPLVDERFRTLPEKEHTFAIGTSLGGQASLHLLLRHPEVFGGAACLSPAFQPATIASVLATAATEAAGGGGPGSRTLRGKLLYLDNGGDCTETDVTVPFFDLMDHASEQHWWNPGYWWLDTQLQPGVDAMRAALDAAGVEYEYRKVPGGRHNERAWAGRIDGPLLRLFGR